MLTFGHVWCQQSTCVMDSGFITTKMSAKIFCRILGTLLGIIWEFQHVAFFAIDVRTYLAEIFLIFKIF